MLEIDPSPKRKGDWLDRNLFFGTSSPPPCPPPQSVEEGGEAPAAKYSHRIVATKGCIYVLLLEPHFSTPRSPPLNLEVKLPRGKRSCSRIASRTTQYLNIHSPKTTPRSTGHTGFESDPRHPTKPGFKGL